MYDCIVVGAGLSGLYCAWRLKQEGYRVLVLERLGRIGGRIKTQKIEVKGQTYIYEAGAQRFSNAHERVINLILKLGLSKHMRSYHDPSETHYVEAIPHPKPASRIEPSSRNLIQQLINKAKALNPKHKQANTTEAIGEELMGPEFIRDLIKYSGYDLGITAKDYYDYENYYKAMNDEHFFDFEGGLLTLCEHLAKGLECHLGEALIDFSYEAQTYTVLAKTTKGKYFGRRLILALPRSALLKLPALDSLETSLRAVSTNTYMRIYAIYPRNADGHYWFEDLPKLVTDSHIRQIIPEVGAEADNGLIQLSYSDGRHAEIWFNYAMSELLKPVIHTELRRMFPNKVIPDPIYFQSHYEKEGTHYWLPNNSSAQHYEKVLQPLEAPVYICGEAYSHYQGWMEGALETAEEAIDRVMNKTQTQGASTKANGRRNKLLRGGGDEDLPLYTLEEVAKHNNRSDAWIALDGFVYDVTKWIPQHPGGDEILRCIGKDGTATFNSIGHPSYVIETVRPQYRIGRLHQ